MLIIPLQANIASQVLTVNLSNQQCTIAVYQKRTGLFVDLKVSDSPIVMGVIAHNANLIVRDPALGFIGDLSFFDTEGTADPDYTGLGGQFILAYLEPADLA
jgi:hypothetical protein